MVVSAAVVTQLGAHGTPWILAVVIALVVGLAVGAVNALLIVGLGLNGFIATLGTLTALEGLGQLISHGAVLTDVSAHLVNAATYTVGGIQAIAWLTWLIAIALWYVFDRTPACRYLLFVGGSPRAARLAGLDVARIRSAAFLSCGLLAALAGVLFQARSAASIRRGWRVSAAAIRRRVLGRDEIAVGRFNALGTVVGLYLLDVGIAGLQLFGANQWVTDFFNGVALIAAIAFARLASRRRSS